VTAGSEQGSFGALFALLRNRNAVLGIALLGVIGVVNGTMATLVQRYCDVAPGSVWHHRGDLRHELPACHRVECSS